MNCPAERLIADRDGWTCRRCGQWSGPTDSPAVKVYMQCRPGVGDRLAAALKRFGVRECGSCQKRRAALNRLGMKLQERLQSLWQRLS